VSPAAAAAGRAGAAHDTAPERAVFPRGALFLVAGPCQLEDDALNLRVAEHVARLGDRVPGGVVFKASFDKANRSNPGAARGPGLERGLAALARVKQETGLRVLTDVHLPEQCAPVARSPTCCRSRRSCAARPTSSRRPARRAPGEHQERAVDAPRGDARRGRQGAAGVPRVRAHVAAAGDTVAVTERGSFFGYGDLVVDMRAISRMRAACDAPVIFDATHSVQQPGRGNEGASGGLREFIPPLAAAAVAAGADGLFVETHPDPACAPSDGPNMVPLADLDALVARLVRVWEAARA
jgi:2-dehydro-3-deoxyphosphooctonate aldolase (KDO 8-P synthase)